jgi:hypothetical protein
MMPENTIGDSAMRGHSLLLCLILAASALADSPGSPLQLDPANPRYLRWNGKPVILAASGEHYGAVLNLDFDFKRYLHATAQAGLNLTRTFSGTYREVPGSFNIQSNTLAPQPGRYQAPWLRVSAPDEPERFDLEQFDPRYFERLNAFLEQAAEQGIIVEFSLFCPFYEQVLWDANPLNARNNIQNIGKCPREEVYTLKHADVTRVQIRFVQEVVRRLNRFDNLYYEICNEPYFGGVTLDWQARIAQAIADTERDLPKKHLIAQNIANDKARVDQPNPLVSIFNFHYATPPFTVGMNAHLNRPIADDETGFRGNADQPYRIEAWQFLLAGGAIISNLDYSFSVQHPEGTAAVNPPTPGGGGPSLRQSIAAARAFVESFPFTRMKPDTSFLRETPQNARIEALAESGRNYALHLVADRGPITLALDLPPGAYTGQWIDTRTGRPAESAAPLQFTVDPGRSSAFKLESPPFTEDIALALRGDPIETSPADPQTRTQARPLPRLKISPNQRFLITEDGHPFFYLGDTAWELFHRLNREETDLYLRDRAEKAFTVIQAVVLAELDGLHTPNAQGDKPLLNDDPAQPNEAYFRHVDWVVDRARALGLYIGMLPTWGDKVNQKWGAGPEVFTPDNAQAYGRFLGKRYKDAPIIWILGGDRPIENENHRRVWDAMAAGLREGDAGNHLITYHPMGGQSSADFLAAAPWIDFHMIQSGHAHKDAPNYDMIQKDYERTPVKPVLDAEPRYEDHPIDWKPENGWFDDHDVRKAAYWSVLAGGCGVTYGCHDIWQFWQPGRDPVSHARTPWRDALKLPASSQMKHLRRLALSRPFLDLAPNQDLLANPPADAADHVQAASARDGRFALIYLPTQRAVHVRLDRLRAERLQAWWFDPRNGIAHSAGQFPAQGTHAFQPPADSGPDWVLVIDDLASNYPAP